MTGRQASTSTPGAAATAAPDAPRAGAGWIGSIGRSLGLPPAGVWLWALLPAVFVAGAAAAALLGRDAYRTYTGEDGVVETLQVAAYAVALVAAVRLTLRLRATGAARWLVTLYALLVAGLVFMIGEELSWGQRIVGWGTPDTLASANKQAETNLHNIYGVGDTFKWIQMLAGAYGSILPFAVGRGSRFAARRADLAWIVPAPPLALYFAPMFVWRIYRNVFPDPARFNFLVTEFNEVVELIFALGIAWFLVLRWRAARPPAAGPGPADRS
ncbi:hypothetical protein DCC79_01690 [bacterium]|nr:MAG: hypothetical protein DCC79_01690 [bacterium]